MSGPAGASLEGVAPSLSYYLGTYSAAAQLTGLSPLSGAPIAAGAYTVLASFAGSTDYAAVVALANYGIGQATPSVNVVDPGGTFSDAAFNASTTVSGVVPGVDDTPAATLEGVAPSLSCYLGTYSEPAQLAGLTALPAVPIGAGSYTVAADFGGSADYSAALAMANFTISPASPAVNVVAAGGTYNGAAFAASATVSGLNGVAGANLEGIAPSLSYYAGTYSNVGQLTGLQPLAGAPDAVGVYTALASFPGSADYSSAQALADFTVSPATPTVGVDDSGGTYSGTAFVATASVAGVNGPAGSTLEGIAPSLSYYLGTYNDPAQLEGLPALSGAPTTVGTYTVLASFPGSADYGLDAAVTDFRIAPALPTVGVVNAGGAYRGTAFVATASVTGVSGPSASALEGVSPSLSYYEGTYSETAQLTGQTALPGAPVQPGNYTVLAAFTGSADYSAAEALASFNVTPATPSVSVTDPGGTYSGTAFSASTTVAGVVPGVDNTPGPSLQGVAPSLSYYTGSYHTTSQLAGLSALPAAPIGAGNYTAVADFGGSADYSAALALADFTISPATPTVNVVDAGGTYDGLFYDGSASVAGLAGVSGLTLEGASLTLSYYAGSSTGGMPLGAAPLAAGTYTVLATFPGSADYGFATASVSFNIAPAVPTVDVSDPSGSFDGSAFVGSATVAGVSGPSRSTLESISPTLSYYSGSYSSVSQLSGLSELSGAPVWAGTYTVLAAFPGSTDYTAAAGLALFQIGQATPTVNVNAPGGAYSGAAIGGSATVIGVGGAGGTSLEGVAPSLTYYQGTYVSPAQLTGLRALPGPPILPGGYTLLAAFGGGTDYTAAVGLATFHIGQATPTLDVVDAGGTYRGAAFSATATVSGRDRAGGCHPGRCRAVAELLSGDV